MTKKQEYKIGAAANEFVNKHRAELSLIKKAELEAMLKDFAIEQVKKCYTEEDMDNAYDKGFKDGNKRDLTGSLIEVL